jgi:plasmid replication initiation protein
MLTAEDFLTPPSRRVSIVDLPVRGGQAAVRGLFAMEAVRLSDALREAAGDPQKLLATQLAAFLCDADGHALLSLDQAMNAVGNMEPSDLRALIEAGNRINRLTDETIEEVAKN